MEINTILLAVIGLMLIYVAYLQLRLSFASRPPTVVVVPPAKEEQSGCGVPVLAVVLAIAALAGAIAMLLPALR